MASGLDALVGAATEGMRKTQSAEEMQPEENTEPKPAPAQDGHMSDSAAAPTRERKKGVPWTEDEHRLFLLGLQKLGKGDWRGISRHFVQSRTPTQVASHAQKYFIRQNNMNKRKRRSSLFDIVNEAPEEPAKGAGRIDGVAGGATGAPLPGGLSMAFASHLGGYNPTGVAPPTSFSAHGATPPGTLAAASASLRGDKSASTSDIGTAGEAAAATIAALSMAGSPAATAGYRAAAAAAAAAAPGARVGSFPGASSSAADLDAAAKAAQAQAQAAQVNGFAAMMAQMGAMGHMGQMGSFPPPANWMATYHQFLSQMTAAAAQPGAGMAGGMGNPFAAMPMGASPGVTFPPAMMGGMHMPGAVPAFPGSAPGGLFRPTAARAAPGAPASAPNAGSAEEKAAMVTA